MKTAKIGFVVVDASEDWEQTLALETGDGLPDEGVLQWRDEGAAFVFPTRQEARTAIDRTEHYRRAFSSNHPEKQNCKIVPLEQASQLDE